MISKYTFGGLTWVDLESPTREEVIHIGQEFNLPNVIGEEILINTLRSRVDFYDDFIYIILHFPTGSGEDLARSGEKEVDFILGKKFLITVRYEIIDPLHKFAKLFEKNSLGSNEKMMNHSGYVFMEMMKQFYENSIYELEQVNEKLKDIEDRIFKNQEELMVKEISKTGRKLLDFKQSIRFHQEILKSYETSSENFFGQEYGYYASIITSEFNKVNGLLENNRDTLAELQRTNDSMLSTKQSSIMKKFTIISFVTFPLMLVTGIFGMNTVENLIFIQTNNDFFFVIGAMLLTSLIMFTFFKFQKWL